MKYTEKQRQDAMAGFALGMTPSAIAKEIGVPESMVQYWKTSESIKSINQSRKKYSLTRKQEVFNLVDQGMPVIQVAKQFKMRPSTIYEWLKHRHEPKKRVQKAETGEMLKAIQQVMGGRTLKDVAKETGINLWTLTTHTQRFKEAHGIPLKIGGQHGQPVVPIPGTYTPESRARELLAPVTPTPVPTSVTPTPEQIEASVFDILLRGMKNKHSDEEYNKLLKENEKIHNELHALRSECARYRAKEQQSMAEKLRAAGGEALSSVQMGDKKQ